MAQSDVAAAAVQLPIQVSERPAIWNAGPGTLYLGRSNSVAVDNGFPVAPSTGYEWPGDVGREVWAISDSTCDVRILTVG